MKTVYYNNIIYVYIQTLSRVADAVDRINKTADREYFIKIRGTGKLRPTDRVVEL